MNSVVLVRQTEVCVGAVGQLLLKLLSLVNWLSQHEAATSCFVVTFLSHLARHVLKRLSAVVTVEYHFFVNV